MGRMSHDEWTRAAEKSAAEAYGRDHKGWYTFRHYAPAIGVAVAVAVIGAGVWWSIVKVSHVIGDVHAPTASSSVPLWVWVAMAVAAIVSFVLLRPSYIPSHPGVMLAKILGVALVWLALIGLALGYGIG